MNSQELRNLQEAYMEVVENQQLDEGKSSRPRYSGPERVGLGPAGSERRTEKRDAAAENMRGHTEGPGTVTKNPKKLRKQEAMRELRGSGKAEVEEGYIDIYDIILSHLLDEGYADTQQQAEVIMVNMSEGWREEIMEGVRPTPVDQPLNKKKYNERRRSLRRREASADAESRGHVGKEWYNSGRRYSPDEARRSRANLDDEERRTRHRSAVDPDNEDDNNFSADRTKNPKKLRKQAVMDKNG